MIQKGSNQQIFSNQERCSTFFDLYKNSCNVFETIQKIIPICLKLVLCYLINTCQKIASSRSCCTPRNFYGRCPAGRGRHNVKICVCVCVYVCICVSVMSLHLLSKRPSSFCLIHFSGAPRGHLWGSSGVKADLRWKTTFDGRRLQMEDDL